MRVIFCGSVLVFLVASCEPGIVFTEPQPADATSLNEFPENYRGDYWALDPKNPEISENGPAMLIRKDSLVLVEYRTGELHKNYVDGASYVLRDNELYRDSKQISFGGVELKGDHYTYISKIDSLVFEWKEGSFHIKEKDSVFHLQADVRTGNGYLAINLREAERKSDWQCLVFRKNASGQLEILAAPDADKISAKLMTVTYGAVMNESKESYVVTPKNRAAFEKLLNTVFIRLLILRKR